jgi:hypothetical protein
MSKDKAYKSFIVPAALCGSDGRVYSQGVLEQSAEESIWTYERSWIKELEIIT